MIDDELSDHEDRAQRAERKLKKEQLLKQQQAANDGGDDNQIDSSSAPKVGASGMYN